VALSDYFDDDRYLRAAEAARILRVSTKTLGRWAKDGRIPHVVTLGGHRRFPSTAVHDLARKMTISPE
jgi:excisionase family DNA binding protein